MARGKRQHLWKVGLLVLCLWAAWGTSFNPLEMLAGLGNVVDFLWEFWPPDLSSLDILMLKTIETIQIAVLGTLGGAIGALLLAPMASRSITSNSVVYHSIRLLFDASRGISEIVWSLLFVVAFGLGPPAGILALIVHEMGALGRYLSETIEAIDADVLDVLKLTGAPKWGWLLRGVYPAIGPFLLNYTFYYFEHSIRAATVLGLVGAGGIGFELTTAVKLYNFGRVTTVLFIIMVLIVSLDRASASIRKQVLALDTEGR